MEDIQGKIDSLLQYRDELDDEDREVFDILVGHAREIAVRKRMMFQV